MENYSTIKVDKLDDFIIKITLNRPEFSNAFNTEMAIELYKFFEDVAMHPRETRVVLITGSGDRAFCAGGDLKQRLNMSNEEWFSQHLVFERMARAVISCPVPIIAVVNGAAYGGGCELAAACDFIYAADHAKFALPETSLGILPGAAGTQTVSRAIGTNRAKELIFTGRSFSADEAVEWGLVNIVVPGDELQDYAFKSAKAIACNAPIAVRQAKIAISQGSELSLSEAMRFEIEAYNTTVTTQDRCEGINAFNEKRKPIFHDK